VTQSRGAQYFESLYAADPDPWDFETSLYEGNKYRSTLEMLAGQQFSAALEIGCSIGVLTHMLAAQCEALLAVDIAPSALAAAASRCAALSHIRFENRQIPAQWPARKFDLMVFSEVLYFLSPLDIAATANHACSSALPGAIILLVNYTEQIDEPCSGDEAAETFINAANRCNRIRHANHEKFRIDLLRFAKF
jgi:predicted TPR repeat methyltransferase